MRENFRGAKPTPLKTVMQALASEPEWLSICRDIIQGNLPRCSLHLAVFVQPYLEYILDGRKTVESRFSAVRFPPYGRVSRGDLVLLKQSGGPVVGICEVGAAWFYQLEPESWSTIRLEFTRALCAEDPEFWKSRQGAAYATLMYVSRVKKISPIIWPKSDRRGWVVLQTGANAPPFGGAMRTTMLAFSGGIASGKSTLSEAVAQTLGCPRVSFGTYIREEAKRRGLGDDRRTLQELGEQLVREDVDGLCAAVLAQATWSPGSAIVIDGVRHIVVAQKLRSMAAPALFRLVYVSADGSTRASRLAARGEAADRLVEYEKHSTEHDIKNLLPESSDLVVDGRRGLDAVIEEVATWAEALP
jgi:dephospho-CoA kinase